MGSDCSDLHRGPCLCGQGVFLVEECEPDHPFAKASQRWWRSTIECARCQEEYRLIEYGKDIVVVRNADIGDRSAIENRYLEKQKEFVARPDVRALLDEFAQRLDTFRSKAEVYRFLSGAGFFVRSQAHFTRHWNGGTEWVKSVRSSKHIHLIMNALGRSHPEISKALAGVDAFRQTLEPLPRVGQPVARIG